MSSKSYSNIFVRYGNADRDILTKQLKMFKERFHSYIVLLIFSEEDDRAFDSNRDLFDDTIHTENESVSNLLITYCKEKKIVPEEVLYICPNNDVSDEEKTSGFEIKDPVAMTQSYRKALEMLQQMVNSAKPK